MPIEKVFRILAGENDIVRALWTADIVGAGMKAGLKFDEKWREPGVAAGPLPALFLRESATALHKTRVPLGLFLGFDYPIAQSNLFTGVQAAHFERVRATGHPEFFHAADIGRYTAMFADLAVAPGCVSCHNEHANSPKTDWKLKDIMGAHHLVLSEGAGDARGSGRDHGGVAIGLRRRLRRLSGQGGDLRAAARDRRALAA
jgi:hypothetical protein